MKLFQKLIAAPALISLASGFAINAAEINSTDLSDYSNSNDLVSLGDFKSDTLFPGDWAYDSLKDLTNSPKFNGNSVTRLEAAAELNNLIAGGEGLMNGVQIERLSDELGSELAIMKGRVDGLEARVNTIEAGSFSDTTTASFKAAFVLGAEDSSYNETSGTGTATESLLAGKPVLMLPTNLEQLMTAYRMQDIGAGLYTHASNPDKLESKLKMLLETDSFKKKAIKFSTTP